MSGTTDIRAVEMVRRIRDEQAAQLQGKTDQEVIEFFGRAAQQAREDAVRRFGKPPAAA